jgi:glyoxylase-like metal-dependent hydrolase (beta-lactamase superfamily II)
MQMQMFLHRALPLQLPQVERGLAEGEEIAFGHQRVKVINTPGHTPGGVCYYLADAHLLLSGDSLFRYSIGRCDLPGSDGASLVRALQEKILALPDETLVLPGHGPETNIADERVGNPYL